MAVIMCGQTKCCSGRSKKKCNKTKASHWIPRRFRILLCQSCHMYLSESIHGFLLFVTWICRNCCIDLLRLLLGFVKVVLCIAKQNQDEVWPRFQSLLKFLLWTKGVEWIKALNAFAGITSKCIWARNKGGNDFYCFTFDGSQVAPKDNLVPEKKLLTVFFVSLVSPLTAGPDLAPGHPASGLSPRKTKPHILESGARSPERRGRLRRQGAQEAITVKLSFTIRWHPARSFL